MPRSMCSSRSRSVHYRFLATLYQCSKSSTSSSNPPPPAAFTVSLETATCSSHEGPVKCETPRALAVILLEHESEVLTAPSLQISYIMIDKSIRLIPRKVVPTKASIYIRDDKTGSMEYSGPPGRPVRPGSRTGSGGRIPSGGTGLKYSVAHDNDHYSPPPLSGNGKGRVLIIGYFHD